MGERSGRRDAALPRCVRRASTSRRRRSCARSPRTRSSTTSSRAPRCAGSSSSTRAQGPLVLVLDDMQWADDETLALVSELAIGARRLAGRAPRRRRGPRCSSARRAGVRARVDHTRIDLRNLEPDDAEQMFRNLLARCDDDPRRHRAERRRDDRRQPGVPRAARAAVPAQRHDRRERRRSGSSIPTGPPRPSCRSASRRRSRRASRRSRTTSATCSRRPRCSATCSGCRR